MYICISINTDLYLKKVHMDHYFLKIKKNLYSKMIDAKPSGRAM